MSIDHVDNYKKMNISQRGQRPRGLVNGNLTYRNMRQLYHTQGNDEQNNPMYRYVGSTSRYQYNPRDSSGAMSLEYENLLRYFIDVHGENRWNQMVVEAARHGQYSYDRDAYNWKNKAVEAARHGHLHIVQNMIERGANNWEEIALEAARRGHLHIILNMVRQGANDLNRIALIAVRGGHCHTTIEMIRQGANNYDALIKTATIRHRQDIVNEIQSVRNPHKSTYKRLPTIKKYCDIIIITE